MNQVQLTGRLVRDPNKTETQSGMTITKFTVASDRMPDKNGDRKSDFISCIAFGKTGDTVARYFHKGKPIGVIGRIQTGSYEGKDGKTVYTTDVVCDRIEFLPQDKTQQSDDPDPRRVNAEIDGIQRAGKAARQESFDDFDALDEEVPF